MRTLFFIPFLAALTASADTNLTAWVSVENSKAVLKIQASNGIGNFRIIGSTVTATNPVAAAESSNSVTNLLVHYWSFDEGSGSTVDDPIGGADLTLGGDASWTASGLYGAAGLFDTTMGGRYYASDSGVAALNTNALTVAVWVYPTALPGGGEQYGIVGKGATSHWTVQIKNDGSGARFQGLLTANTSVTLTATNVPATNAWSLLTLIYDGTTASFGVNTDTPTTASLTGTITTVSDPVTVGRIADTSGTTFTGRIDEVALWHRALSTNDVQTLYNSGTGYNLP